MHSMSSSKYVFLFFSFVLVLALVLASTSYQSEKKNSVLILAFDRLPNDTVTCSDERTNENSGFAMLCKESIRFTHAYTTSLQPAAAMGSLLSGQYPHQHKLHRSYDRISEKIQLISEIAYLKKYRTSFFSGSPHILKKTGLSKFFETFDDLGPITEKNYSKDFKSQISAFLEWYFEDPKPFFSVIYNSDLEFLKIDESNQFEKLDDKLAVFFQQLKTENIWDSTTIVLVGLNGVNKFQRLNETAFQNLHSENTQVVTLVKLPRAKGDEGVYWKNDTVIQLADVGLMLKNSLATKTEIQNLDDFLFPILNLNSILTLKSDNVPTLRQILIEAPNTWTKQLSSIQYAVLQNHELYLDGAEPALFNTLLDRMETTNLYSAKKSDSDKIRMNLDILKNKLKLHDATDIKSKKIVSSDKLISINISFENIWGLSPLY